MDPGSFVVLVLLGIFAVGGGVFYVVRDRQRLAEIGKMLGGGSNFSSAWGAALGVHATLQWQRSRDRRLQWTVITAELPAKVPFLMSLRLQGWRARSILDDAGDQGEVAAGERCYDPVYAMEAAPADVAQALLTPARRTALASHGQFELDTELGPPRRLRLRIPAVLDEPQTALPALLLAVDLATGVRQAYATVEAAAETRLVGAPFREHPDATSEQQAAQRRMDEVQQLEAKRANAPGLGANLLLAATILLIILIISLWAARL